VHLLVEKKTLIISRCTVQLWKLPTKLAYYGIREAIKVWIESYQSQFVDNSLTMNTDKTTAMLFHFNKTSNLVKPKIFFKNAEINYTSEEKCYIKKNNVYLRRNLDLYKYNLSRNCDFHVLSCNTLLFKKSVINMRIRLYSKMSTKIKHLESFGDFKQRLKLFLMFNILIN
jgi:hypothetical protein